MKRLSVLAVLVVSGLFYQNCAQNVMSFDHADHASALGVGLQIVPDAANVREIQHEQKYQVEVTLPEKGEIQKETILIDGTPVEYTKNAFGNYEFAFTPPAPTTYKIVAEVWTPTGAKFETSAELRIVDDYPPVIKITPDTLNKYEDLPGASQRFDIEITDEGGGFPREAKCYIGTTATSCPMGRNGRTHVTTTGLGGGIHTLHVDAVDNYGNSRRESHPFSIGADLIAPVVRITEDTSNSNYTIDTQKFVLSASDSQTGLKSVTCTLNSVALTTCPSLAGGTVNLSLVSSQLREGVNTLSVRAEDKARKDNMDSPNVTVVNYSFDMLVDRDPPSIRLVKNPANTNLVNQLQRVAFEVKDEGSGLKAGSLQCRLNGAAVNCNASASGVGEIAFTPTAPGSYIVEVSVADRYDNSRTDSVTVDVARDSNVPVVTITEHTNNPSVILIGTTARFNFTVRKDGNLSTLTSVRCFVENTAVSCNAAADLKSGTFAGAFAAKGRRSVRVEATDSTGNIGQRTYEILVYELAPATVNITVNEIRSLDVLIVIDDSASMKAKQANMAQRIGSFTSKLSGLDWRAGVITTDVVHLDRIGQLQPIVGKPATANRWVTSAEAPDKAQKFIGDTVQAAGIKGNAAEQGIKAANLLISAKDDAPNTGFFRSNAALAILFIADEDESRGNPKNLPNNLVSLIQRLWPSKPFRAHSIIKTTDNCSNGSIGTKYMELSNMTGGEIGCVGDADYSPILAKMGQSTAELVNSATLTCSPYNNQVIVRRGGAVQNIPYTISGTSIRFANALPIGNYQLSYNCLR